MCSQQEIAAPGVYCVLPAQTALLFIMQPFRRIGKSGIGSATDENYLFTRKKLEKAIEKYEGVNYIYYQIEDLENLYYQKKSQRMDIDWVKILLGNI